MSPQSYSIRLAKAITVIRKELQNAEDRHKTRMANAVKENEVVPQTEEFLQTFDRINAMCYEIHDEFKKIRKMEKVIQKEKDEKPYRDKMAGRNKLQVKL